MTRNPSKRALRFRSVFISDVHLGCRGSRADYLLDFLKSIDTDHLYLVGDIVDGWSMSRSFYWPQTHNNVLRLILSKAKHGSKVTYIPGNHDAPFREHVGLTFGNVIVQREAIHTTADGRVLLVMHGDEFDTAIRCGRWLSHVGHHAYDLILNLNRYCNGLRRALGYPYWSLATYLKQKAGSAVKYIDRFESAALMEAKRRGMDGVVCGHIHRPKLTKVDGLDYLNCGDWVESCTALTEDFNGRFTLLHWSERQHVVVDDARNSVLPQVA